MDSTSVRAYFEDLQDRLSAALAALDGAADFAEDSWVRPQGGGGRSRVLEEGALFERGGVAGNGLPRSRWRKS